jgi:hypothetical protein
MRLFSWVGVVALATAAIVTAGSVPAGAVTTVGVAVSAVGSTDPAVGTTESRPALGGDAIKYFIPLRDGGPFTYGVGSTCKARGMCSDTGDGGAILQMILRFSPISTTAPSTLTINFDDLDLNGVNDPSGFFESLNIFRGATSLTGGWIKNISSLFVDGDHNIQTLSLLLNLPITDPLYLVLKFKAKSDFNGTNTAEYLRATITTVEQETPPPLPTPLPGALVLMGSVLAGSFGFGAWRRRRARPT